MKSLFSETSGKTLGFGVDIGSDAQYSISQHYSIVESKMMHDAAPDLFGEEFQEKYGRLIGIDQFEPNHHFSYHEENDIVYMYDSETGKTVEICSGEEFLHQINQHA